MRLDGGPIRIIIQESCVEAFDPIVTGVEHSFVSYDTKLCRHLFVYRNLRILTRCDPPAAFGLRGCTSNSDKDDEMSDSRRGSVNTDAAKTRLAESKKRKTRVLRESVSPLPVCGISRDGIYLASEILWRCRIAPRTLTKWFDDGLPYSQPGSKDRFVFGDDLIAYLRSKAIANA